MASLTSRLIDAADRMVTKFGTTASFLTEGTVTINPQAGTVSRTSQSNVSVTVSFPVSFDTQYINGTTIQEQDLMIIIAQKNLTFTPFLDQEVTIDSVLYTVKHLENLRGTSGIAWLIGLRR